MGANPNILLPGFSIREHTESPASWFCPYYRRFDQRVGFAILWLVHCGSKGAKMLGCRPAPMFLVNSAEATDGQEPSALAHRRFESNRRMARPSRLPKKLHRRSQPNRLRARPELIMLWGALSPKLMKISAIEPAGHTAQAPGTCSQVLGLCPTSFAAAFGTIPKPGHEALPGGARNQADR